MAAHVYTALQQIEEDITEKLSTNLFSHLRTALDLSTWTEDLDIDEYGELSRIVDLHTDKPLTAENSLLDWVREKKAKYEKLWKYYGEPRTREQWLTAKYGELG
jgi:hypothetical protein